MNRGATSLLLVSCLSLLAHLTVVAREPSQQHLAAAREPSQQHLAAAREPSQRHLAVPLESGDLPKWPPGTPGLTTSAGCGAVGSIDTLGSILVQDDRERISSQPSDQQPHLPAQRQRPCDCVINSAGSPFRRRLSQAARPCDCGYHSVRVPPRRKRESRSSLDIAAETETETETEKETEPETEWYLEKRYSKWRYFNWRYLEGQYYMRRYLVEMTPVEPLAENRTRRVDPLQHFQYYEGGWDPSSKDYWASVAWAGIYGLVVGAAWVVLGISILAFALCACLFCRKRWKARLDGDQPQYTPFQIRVPLAALLLAAVVILVGFALLVAGGVLFHSTYLSATQFTLATTQALVGATHNLSAALQCSANTTLFDAVIPTATQQAVLQGAAHAESMADDIQARIVNSIERLDGYVKIVTITILVIGSLTALLVLLGLVAGFLQWAVASHILVSLIWAMGFITWSTVTLCLLSTLFAGDTSAAMWQVSQQDPVGNSSMQQWLPCARASDVRQAINTTVTALAASVSLLNTSVVTTYPQVLTAVNATGICNPYAGGGADLSYDVTSCPPGTLPPAAFFKALTTLTCTNGTCEVHFPNGTVTLLQVPPAALSALQNTSAALTQLIDSVPVLRQIANCTYVKEICEYASGLASNMERDFNMLWWGFIVISVASMLLALALPVYIFRSAHPQADPRPQPRAHVQAQPLALPPGESFLSSPPHTPPHDSPCPPCAADGPDSAASGSAGAADGMSHMEDLQFEDDKDQSSLARDNAPDLSPLTSTSVSSSGVDSLPYTSLSSFTRLN